MISNDYRLKENDIQILSNMKGKKFNSLVADNAFGGTKAIGNALFSVGNVYYTFSNKICSLDYYGSGIEDVAIFNFETASENLINKEKSFERAIEIPIKQKIRDIEIVTEIQKVFEKDVLKYETKLTRGVIFYMIDNYEISYEKDIWFSEIIKIQRGYKLIEKFTPTTEFEEDWNSNFTGHCERICEFL